MQTKTFSAPWSRGLKTSTALLLLFCVATVFGVWRAIPDSQSQLRFIAFAMPLIFLISSLWMVRGYAVQGKALLIKRLLWTTRIDLYDLERAQVDGDVTAGSLRIAGVGGLFVYAGWFWNKELRRYRLYATDRELAVVLYFRDHRPVVVTPHDPEAFVAAIQSTG